MLDQSQTLSNRPTSGEAPFPIKDVFFSRTDTSGIIEAFNGAFSSVADYPPSDLLRAPHKILRHPDMPKAVFWLMWDAINAGRPFGAYVKNRARDGLHFWVFAVVIPVDGGYVSVHLKPTSDLLPMVETLYGDLVKKEHENNLDPEESAARLNDALKSHGFSGHDQFQAEALMRETKLRDVALKRSEDRQITGLSEIVQSLREMRKSKSELGTHFEAVKAIPNNLRIMASRIEPSGGPITAISANYKSMSEDVVQQLHDFSSDKRQNKGVPSNLDVDGLFNMCGSRLMQDVIAQLESEGTQPEGIDCAGESQRLRDLDQTCRLGAETALKQIVEQVQTISQEAEELRRMVVGLDSIRVMCRVESGRMGHQYEGLVSIIENLDKFHSLIDQKLKEVGTKAQLINKDAEHLSRTWVI
ncbi:PAS domain-containing protein [Aliiroseovarius sp. PTFE2010]|uniref:PAS domain-containing protein n=1 Tax=Aliiroseovarius sp. PTFE2010 TaxID=3417190 RepID=UPI003CE8A5F3